MISFEELLEYHGGNSPGGVAHAYKVLERALELLGPCELRELAVETAFKGPGARDAIERATGRPPTIVESLARPGLGRARERFVFRVSHGDRAVTLVLREGWVSDEFIDLARTDPRTPEQEERLTALKQQMAERVMAAPADAVYSS